jgi:glucokinase
MSEKLALGIDLGGTETKVCLVSESGEILNKAKVQSLVKEGIKEVERIIIGIILRLLSDSGNLKSRIVGAGLGFPGFVDSVSGVGIGNSPNIKEIEGYPLRENIEKAIGLKVVAGNDAKCYALGESWVGAGSGARTMCFFGIGTGIGGGVVIDGKPYLGIKSMAGELGHVSIDFNGRFCGCGRRGCLEAYIGTSGFFRTWDELKASKQFSTTYFPKAGQENIKEIFLHAKKGDEVCLATVKTTSIFLAKGMISQIIAWNPDVFVIGGQVSRDWDLFGPLVNNVIQKDLGGSMQKLLLEGLRIVPAKYPSDGGCLGAAKSLFDSLV